MSIDTLIFDWDGTLADSIGHIVSTMQSAAVAVGLPVPSDEAVKGIIGLGLPEAAAVLFPQRPDLAVPVVDAYRDIYLSD
ncbi:MAG TPA: HAD family hydrolase, partial [Pseudomonas pachastrellae]|nr:HAD family hydrolase [Halopseudomonas pachastrellae]